jgi:hypothetical protein
MPDSKSKNYMIMTNEGKGTLTFLLWILKSMKVLQQSKRREIVIN